MLLDTYNPYKPAVIDWPALSEAELARIAALPFWDTAVAIEGRAALRMEWQAGNIDDPLISEALTLNAAEERRHKEVLHNMLANYVIETGPEPRYLPPKLWSRRSSRSCRRRRGISCSSPIISLIGEPRCRADAILCSRPNPASPSSISYWCGWKWRLQRDAGSALTARKAASWPRALLQ